MFAKKPTASQPVTPSVPKQTPVMDSKPTRLIEASDDSDDEIAQAKRAQQRAAKEKLKKFM